MALVKCSECGREISDQAATCVNCGARNPHYRKPTPLLLKLFLGVVALFAAFLTLGFILKSNDPTADERYREREAISYCEDQYEKLKEDPRMTQGALGIAYGACEKMKSDYRDKWQREP